LWTRNFVIVCALNFLNFSGMWMLPAMLPLFIRTMGAPTYMLGWVMGLTAIATIISRPLAGLAVDRFGRRRVFAVGTIGMLVTAATYSIMPFYQAILAIRFVQGLAWGLTNTACTTIGADSIAKPRYAEGMGWFQLASSLAMVLSPALSLALFYAVGGAVSSLVCAGFFALSLVCSCFVAYRKTLAPAAGAGLATRGAVRHAAPKTLAPAVGAGPTDAGVNTPARTRRKATDFIKDTLFEKSALLLALLMMLTASAYGIVQTFLPDALDSNAAHDFVGVFFVVMAVAALAARPAFGRWADKRGYFMPALTAFICMAASMALMVGTHELATLVVAAILQGIGYSSGFSLFMALATRHASPERRGTTIATVMVGFDIGSGLTAVALSFLAYYHGYEAIFICGAAIALLGIIVLLARRHTFDAGA
jgi:MFS family permease